MLIIREEQRDTVRRYMLEQYVDRTFEHFQKYFPRYCEIRIEPAVRALIRHGVERARTHGIVGERNVCLYTTLMLILGSLFDEDPQYRWAAMILADESIEDESGRTDRLFDTATDWLDRVAGEDHELMANALMRLRTLDLDTALAAGAGRGFESTMLTLFDSIFPSKCHEVGKAELRQLCRRGIETAQRLGLDDERGRVVITGLMILLGAGCTEDPQHPWIREALAQPRDGDDRPRADALFETAIEHLSQWLQ